ncbi:MAG: hypothetical protein ISR96_09585 [Nitrospira sp.]|nr:hypothetical protein [Nitrospira sp.]
MKKILTYALCTILIMAGTLVPGIAFTAEMMVGEELLPPNAKPGECYARLFVAPTYRTVTEMVLLKEAANQLHTTAPKFEFVDEKETGV